MIQFAFVAIIAVVGDQDPVVGRVPATTVNADLGHVITVAGQGHTIDDIGQGQGHGIEENTDLGHIHENVGDRKTDVDRTALMMIKVINDVSRSL